MKSERLGERLKEAIYGTQGAFAIRFAAYIACVAMIFQGVIWAMPHYSYAEVVQEEGIVENGQLVLILVGLGVLVFLAWRRRETRGLHFLLAMLLTLAWVREHNNTVIYTKVLPVSWMKWVAGLFLLGLLAVGFRRGLLAEMVHFLGRHSILLFLLGGAMVVGWAQVLAQEEIWSRRADRQLEEILELAGYFLIVCGTLEEMFSGMRSVG